MTLLLALAGLLGGNDGERVTVEPRMEFWWPSLSGDFQHDNLEGFLFFVWRDEGTEIDYDGDLGLESSGPALLPSIAFRWGGPGSLTQKLRIHATLLKQKGSRSLDSLEIFEDHAIPQGTPVDSTLRFLRAGATFGVESRFGDDGAWVGEVGFACEYLKTDLHLGGPSLSESEQSADLASTLTGAIGVRTLGFLEMGVALGLGLGFSSFLVDLAFQVRATWGPVSLDIGYRFFLWNFDDGDEKVDLQMMGPSAGLSVTF
jgi:hypothetical protein